MSALLTSTQLWLAWSAYVLIAASPGPSNMAIVGVAMARGRRDALVFAAGVLTGTSFWALMAGVGLSHAMAQSARAMDLLKTLGGLYLLWLAFKSARAAWRQAPETEAFPNKLSRRRLYLRGLALHLTNPKAILAWLSVAAIGLTDAAPPSETLLVIGSCLLWGAALFGGYAIAFSSSAVRRNYQTLRRPIEGLLCAMFGYAGLRLLISRLP
ncbi:MAG: LysE family translocator [Burkholderiaceae bacterium]